MASERVEIYKNIKNITRANPDELRKKRNELNVELRKKKTAENLLKRRMIHEEDFSALNPDEFELHEYKKFVDMANNDENSTDQVHAVQSIRKILSANNSPPIDKLIRLGVIPVLLKCLTKDDDHLLQFESTWALTNIASGTSRDTYEVVKAGAVPLLINLLSSPYTNVCEQALWALGNITGDSPNLRDLVIQAGIIPRLLIFVPQALPSSFLQTIAWVFTNLCRSKEMPPSVEVIREILPALKYQIVSSDQKVIIDTAWALSYLTDYGNDKIELVVQSGVIPYLVPLLSHNETKLKTAALRALGNIVTGTDEQTQAVLDCGILSHFAELLTHTSQKIRKESIWLLSNITAGNERQIQMVLNAQLLPMILENLTHGEYYTKKEAAWCVGNLTVSGSRTQIMELIRFNAIAPFCEMLKCGDSQIIATVLDGIQNILNVAGPDLYAITTMIEECDGLTTIENLQNHEALSIYKCAYDIVDKYFNDEDIDVGTDQIPNNNNNNNNIMGFEYYNTNQSEFDF